MKTLVFGSLYGGGNAAVSVEEINAVVERFGPGDLLVVQNEITHTATILPQFRITFREAGQSPAILWHETRL
ncbi:MAG: hypothetical protein LBK43_09365 [Treponema sp.]|jgi:hypothetical protein|nr:hypothetical protein [Treponema sp.]